MVEKTNRNFLNQIQAYKLTQFIESEYVKLGKSDAEFAELASKAINCEVTERNVTNRRKALGIESTKDVQRERLAKERERKQASRVNPPEFNYNEMIVQRLNAVIERLDVLIRLWKE